MRQNYRRVFGLALIFALLGTCETLRAATTISLDGSGWTFHEHWMKLVIR